MATFCLVEVPVVWLVDEMELVPVDWLLEMELVPVDWLVEMNKMLTMLK